MTNLTITAIAVGAPLGYVFVAGCVFCAVGADWEARDLKPAYAVFWPAVVPFLLLSAVLTLVGGTLPRYLVTRLRRPKLPRAEVRK